MSYIEGENPKGHQLPVNPIAIRKFHIVRCGREEAIDRNRGLTDRNLISRRTRWTSWLKAVKSKMAIVIRMRKSGR